MPQPRRTYKTPANQRGGENSLGKLVSEQLARAGAAPAARLPDSCSKLTETCEFIRCRKLIEQIHSEPCARAGAISAVQYSRIASSRMSLFFFMHGGCGPIKLQSFQGPGAGHNKNMSSGGWCPGPDDGSCAETCESSYIRHPMAVYAWALLLRRCLHRSAMPSVHRPHRGSTGTRQGNPGALPVYHGAPLG